MKHRVISIVGTRPEVIKMAPVIRELNARPTFDHTVVTTAQHREMLDQLLEQFGIMPSVDLGLMEQDQGLAAFASRSLVALERLFRDFEPDAVLIQGDTTTVMTAALAAFYTGAITGHVEAGLRSFDRAQPFPEEMNRRLAGSLADIHFAPTERARENLLREGVAPERIWVTGNTVVDALSMFDPGETFFDERLKRLSLDGRQLILVTAHRRENHGEGIRSVCRALCQLVERLDQIEIVYPVHLSPHVQQTVRAELDGVERIHLVDPLSYDDLLALMHRAHVILTDSGGIQEEAPSFRTPVLVLRDVTERPEAVESGFGRVVGTDTKRIVDETTELILNDAAHRRMVGGRNPFGDGRAAIRIADALESHLSG